MNQVDATPLAMAYNPFLGLDRTTLEAALTAAQTDLLAGKQVSRATVPGMDVTNQMELTISARIRFILQALNKIDPVAYPAINITPATATRISFQ